MTTIYLDRMVEDISHYVSTAKYMIKRASHLLENRYIIINIHEINTGSTKK